MLLRVRLLFGVTRTTAPHGRAIESPIPSHNSFETQKLCFFFTASVVKRLRYKAMSTAHRPNFSAAKGRESTAHLSQQRTVLSIPQHTKLKFRQPASASASSSTSTSASASSSSIRDNGAAADSSVRVSGSNSAKRRDLKRELELAEWEARNKKRLRAGQEPLALPASLLIGQAEEQEDEEVERRRTAVARAIELDRDSDSGSSSDDGDDDDNDDDAEDATPARASASGNHPQNSSRKSSDGSEPTSSSSSSSSESDDASEDESEDEQAQLLLELEKIKRERQAEKARLAALDSATQSLTRQEEIARGNPLLNLQTAFARPSSSSSSPPPTTTPAAQQQQQQQGELSFGVQKRWDHDVIFKNQAQAAGHTGTSAGKDGFVNDLTRSEFHRKFMHRYVR